MLVAIAACEVGFWVVLAAGLVVRYGLRRRRLGGALLLGVPLVDLALLALTAADLRGGAAPQAAHALAALYLGVSVAFGHRVVRWADVRVAHRLAGGPPPPPPPVRGSPARVRAEWRDFGLALVAAGMAAALVGVLVLLAAPGADTAPLVGQLPAVGLVLLVWLLGWPVWESLRAVGHRRS